MNRDARGRHWNEEEEEEEEEPVIPLLKKQACDLKPCWGEGGTYCVLSRRYEASIFLGSKEMEAPKRLHHGVRLVFGSSSIYIYLKMYSNVDIKCIEPIYT